MKKDGPVDGPKPGEHDAAARVDRIEESHVFLERQIDELNAELIAVNKRLAELAARLSRLETGDHARGPSRGPSADAAETLAQAERRTVVEAMARAAGVREQAAQLLGTDRATLERMLIRHGLA